MASILWPNAWWMRRTADWQRSGLRRLQDSDSVTAVATPEELLEALAGGAWHIQITEHLDMTTAVIPSHPTNPDMWESWLYFGYVNTDLTNIITVR